jgi:hypothetical protein
MQVGGAAHSAVGAYYQGKAIKKAADRMRRTLEKQRQENLMMMDRESRAELETATLEYRRAQREERLLGARATQESQRQALAAFASPAYQAYSGFVADIMRGGIPESVAQDASGRLRQAQAARGLSYGQASSKDEANLLTQMALNARLQAAPLARQVALDPFELQAAARQNYLNQAAMQQNIAMGEMQTYLAARGQAQATASNRVNPLLGVNTNIAMAMPFAGVDPKGLANTAIGGSLSGAAGSGSNLAGAFQSKAGSSPSSPSQPAWRGDVPSQTAYAQAYR